jgi:hypothetical protein
MKQSSLVLLALLCPFAALADTVTIPASTTTTIYNGSANVGAIPGTMIVGRLNNGTPCRGLLMFDLSSIPTNATVSSAELNVFVLKSTSASDQHTLHRLTNAWNTSATWLNSGVMAWSGGAFVAAPDSTADVSGFGFSTLPSSAAMVQTVQGWVSGAMPNNGWLLKLDDETILRDARRVAGANYGDPNAAPALTVQFTAPPPPPPPPPAGFTIYNLRNNGSLLQFDFEAAQTNSYIVEYVNQIGGSWHTLTNIAVPINAIATVSDLTTNGMRFYRISATPVTP